ncbi:ABC transporter ATP-binding protein [Chromobacterium haemolyticum]|uniref:ABC transporter ATP-binding protein n=1 Tax=Chromobacterium haemolyticum TaxID=394935 RepID=A0ABS3GMN6_9NEIS|nr:ATP-binding cassette domain-containing protein [Chromobacterium haemolyticum]MBK0415029.1 ABC transporter ATP-binding protein [Chromobacterium haemolyticum]MBO0416301.1 ABC transporter ATP-binding protein [Chromobacterium haemolyticum]MBO0499667.1 ABC transporter ATP-binding protein [Chromobacterium haemolyticum]
MDALDAIILRGLCQRFGAHEALAGVDATIRRGAITGLAGPDGAGKTTLLRLLAGLLQASAGAIRIEGLDPIADGDALRALIGYMPQQFGLYEDLTVQENLELYADLRGVVGERRRHSFERLLAFTDLARFTARPAGKLSGGMKQKLGLACALLGEPRVLLLDEPSVGVDPISRRELWKMVGELAADGMTVLWSTSYLDEAERCDQVLLMNAGQLAYAGAPGELIRRMEGRSVQLRGIAGNRRQTLRRALRQPQVLDGVIQGQALRLVLRQAGQPPELAALQAGPDAHFAVVPPRLEDAFIELLGGGPGGDSALAERMPPAQLPAGVDPDAVIRAKQLTRRFGDFVAADNIDFQVRRGEIYGLLGPNGAGKSTTFKMLCGLLRPSAGEANVMGIDLKRSASRARQQLGYMAQKFALYGNLSVAHNLDFFSGIYGLSGQARRDTVAEMVRVFALAPYLNMLAGALPLGFKQRLALACALMHRPPLLFLDEPTSGVDPITRREFWTHINGLVDKGVTVMVTTHFMNEAEYCDRIGLVYRGRLIASGTPDQLKRQAAGPEEEITMEEAFIRLVTANDRAGAGI